MFNHIQLNLLALVEAGRTVIMVSVIMRFAFRTQVLGSVF